MTAQPRDPHAAGDAGARRGRERFHVGARRRVLLISGWSLVMWSAWSFIANVGQALDAAVLAALTQGVVSLTITALMTTALELVSNACSGTLSRVVVPTLAAVALHASYTIGVHWLAGTPALLATVAPIILFGGLGYSLAYASALVVIAPRGARLPAVLQRLGSALSPSPRSSCR